MFPGAFDDPQSWNKYAYTRNNPLRYVDPNGEDWQDVLKGGLNAFFSDNAAGAGRISGGNSDFQFGQSVGDAVATVTGTVEVLVGSGGEVGGVALDATGVGAVAGIPLNVASAGVIAHGATTAAVAGGNLVSAAFAAGKEPGPTVDPKSGHEVGRFVSHRKGNVMAEPKGGKTVPAGAGGADTHTLYPNGSNAQRLNPQGHANNPTPHGHAHLPGTGPGKKGQGPSLSPEGKVVKPKTKEAHWPINK